MAVRVSGAIVAPFGNLCRPFFPRRHTRTTGYFGRHRNPRPALTTDPLACAPSQSLHVTQRPSARNGRFHDQKIAVWQAQNCKFAVARAPTALAAKKGTNHSFTNQNTHLPCWFGSTTQTPLSLSSFQEIFIRSLLGNLCYRTPKQFFFVNNSNMTPADGAFLLNLAKTVSLSATDFAKLELHLVYQISDLTYFAKLELHIVYQIRDLTYHLQALDLEEQKRSNKLFIQCTC